MPTRQLPNPTPQWPTDEQMVCRDSDHNPPSHQVFAPGLYEHTCPTCYKVTTFRVKGFTL